MLEDKNLIFILMRVSESIKSFTQVQNRFGLKKITEGNSSVHHWVPFQIFQELLLYIRLESLSANYIHIRTSLHHNNQSQRPNVRAKAEQNVHKHL